MRAAACLLGLVVIACGQVAKLPDAQDVGADASVDADPLAPDAALNPAVELTPAMPITVDDLIATVIDPPAGYTLRWFENGVVRTDITTNTVANVETTRGE